MFIRMFINIHKGVHRRSCGFLCTFIPMSEKFLWSQQTLAWHRPVSENFYGYSLYPPLEVLLLQQVPLWQLAAIPNKCGSGCPTCSYGCAQTFIPGRHHHFHLHWSRTENQTDPQTAYHPWSHARGSVLAPGTNLRSRHVPC